MTTYTATLLTFSDEKSYYPWDKEKKFYKFDVIDREEIKFSANSIDDAEAYVIKNYPNRCVGYGIGDGNGNFVLDAVKDYYYRDCGFESMEQILAYKLEMLEKKGVA